MRMFKVGDKVRIEYEYDCWRHNGEIGTLTWVHLYNYYPNRDERAIEERQQGIITYANGDEFGVQNLHRNGCGILSPVELIEESEAKS